MSTQNDDLEASISALENEVTGLAADVKAVRTTQAQMLEITIDIQRRVSGASSASCGFTAK